nr:glycosyltransferase [Actinopolymorpha rutila]
MKVSVVVPVYNPGTDIDRCIESLLGQTLSPDEFEVVFVDDGSTDETPARLDKLAEEHSNVRVIHIPNSGWPGKPRNVGVDTARGEYIQYVDQDDYMAPDALRRLYELGSRNGADIVIGKVVSNWRGVPISVWKTTRHKVTIRDFPLWDSLTPHKMFRKTFLEEQNIRFPEGKRRLEDQLYMIQAYFPAKAVSILGDYTCYYYWRRTDKNNAGSAPIDPVGYYDNLRDVLQVVEDNTEPGAFRDKILRRFYRTEMLGRINDASLLKYLPAYREELFREIRKLALERMTDGVTAGLPALLRMKASLLMAGRLDELVTLAERCRAIKARTPLESVSWSDGRLKLRFDAYLQREAGAGEEVLAVHQEDGKYYLDPALSEELLDWHDGYLGNELRSARVDVSIRDRETAAEWLIPAKVQLTYDERTATDTGDGHRTSVRIRGSVTVDPERAAGGRPLGKGIWDLWARVVLVGFDQRVRLGTSDVAALQDGCLPALLGQQNLLVVPYFTEGHDNLSLDVDRRGKTLAKAVGGRAWTPLPAAGREIELAAPIVHPMGSPAVSAKLVLLNEDDPDAAPSHVVPAALVADQSGRARMVATLRRLPLSPDSRWRVSALLDGDERPAVIVGQLDVDARGRANLAGAHRISRSTLLARRLAGEVVTYPPARRVARTLVGHAPSAVRTRLRRFAKATLAKIVKQ